MNLIFKYLNKYKAWATINYTDYDNVYCMYKLYVFVYSEHFYLTLIFFYRLIRNNSDF